MSGRFCPKLLGVGILAWIFAFFFAPVPPAFAAESIAPAFFISVDPSEQDLTLAPGQVYHGTISVYNIGTETFRFQVSPAPFAYNAEDYTSDFATSSDSTKLSEWISTSDEIYSLEPDHALKIPFTITVPVDAVGGGQYAALMVRTLSSGDASVSFVSQIASLFYATIDGPKLVRSGELVSHRLPGFILGDGFRLSATFKNTGNADFRTTETITIRDLFSNREIVTPTSSEKGRPIGTISSIILPGSTRTIDLTWQGAPELGFFRVTWNINFLDQQETFEGVVFICPLWLLVLVLILLALIVTMFVSLLKSGRKVEKSSIY